MEADIADTFPVLAECPRITLWELFNILDIRKVFLNDGATFSKICIYKVTPKQVKVLTFNGQVCSRVLIWALLQVNISKDFHCVFECVEVNTDSAISQWCIHSNSYLFICLSSLNFEYCLTTLIIAGIIWRRWLSIEHWCNNTDGWEPKYSDKILSHCGFVHHKSHIDWSWLNLILRGVADD